jgi:DNA ligase D-like protein (predicted 3'-phosphoesterase)
MKLKYVIHEHFAKNHHFDLRLEKNGVLKSWAIPKEPPIKEGEKRLAVQVDDHELLYDNFEGLIPKGMYGAGKVKIWDKGTYEIENFDEKKKIVFVIKGKKLKGKYCLLHFKPKEKNWLFFKVKEFVA